MIDDFPSSTPPMPPVKAHQLMASDMTMRDEFAGRALLSALARQEPDADYGRQSLIVHLSRWCYEVADAMMEARKT